MIGNTVEYLQANNLILKNMEMIQGKSIFDDLKPLQASDIVNLSLDILRILLEIHAGENSEECHDKVKFMEDISESSNSFVRFADISIDCQRSNNEDLKKVFHAIGDSDDIDDLITKILVYGRL